MYKHRSDFSLGDILKDYKTEGKKEGYIQAAHDFEKAFRTVEGYYQAAINMINGKRKRYSNVRFFEEIEELNKALNEEVQSQAKERKRLFKKISSLFSIPLSLLSGFSLYYESNSPLDLYNRILGFIVDVKMIQKIKARKAAYNEAKALFEKKVQKLADDLSHTIVKSKRFSVQEVKKLEDCFRELSRSCSELATLEYISSD